MATNAQAANNRAPVFLRSYKNPNNLENSALANMKLWQAARATSAAPAYFKPLQVNGYTLVDGGLGANNPLGWYVISLSDPCGTERLTIPITGSGLKYSVYLALPGQRTASSASALGWLPTPR